MTNNLQKYIVPVFVVVYGENESDAEEYVEHALDSTEFVYQDGIFSVEIVEDEIELYGTEEVQL